MATRKRRSGARRKPATRARKSTSTAIARRRTNPTRRRRGSVVARSKRRTVRQRNPSGKLLPLVIGAGISQIGASLIPFGGGPVVEAVKVAGVGWLLEKFLGRTAPSVFGEAKEGGMIAGGVLLFNAYLAPTLSGAVRSIMPSASAKSDGVKGLMVLPGPGGMMLPAAAQSRPVMKSGVNGAMTVSR